MEKKRAGVCGRVGGCGQGRLGQAAERCESRGDEKGSLRRHMSHKLNLTHLTFVLRFLPDGGCYPR
jgi:hypothetical protein